MDCNRQGVIERLKQPMPVSGFDPIAARFVYSLRLIAVYERARRDPAAELAVRLGSMAVAGEVLSLAREMSAAWPEQIILSRFCCALSTYDEASIARLVGAAASRNRAAFHAELEGLLRPDRIQRLWDSTVRYVGAEYAAIAR